jgi:hypothetical protein
VCGLGLGYWLRQQRCWWCGSRTARYYADEIYAADTNAHQFADMVRDLVENNNIQRCDFVLDSSCFNRTDGLVSVAERFRERQVPVLPATRDRLGSLALLRQLMAERSSS